MIINKTNRRRNMNIYSTKDYTRVFVLIFFVLLFQGSTQVNNSNYLSPETVITDRNSNLIYVTLKESKRISVIDAKTEKLIKDILVPQEPLGLVLSPTKPILYVTGGLKNGKVYEINLETNKIINEIEVGYCPLNPAITPDGSFLYVPNRFDKSISVVDLTKHKEISKIFVPREPINTLLSNDGSILYVAHLLPDSPSDGNYVASSVSVINTSNHQVINSINMPNGTTSLRGMAISPDGQYLYFTHLTGFYNLPTNQIERGWMNTNVFTIFDTKQQKVLTSILLDDIDQGAANPWGVSVSDDGHYLVFSHAGTNELSIVDRVELHSKLERIKTGEQTTVASSNLEDVARDFSILVGLRQRIRLKGIGPRGISIAGNKIFVAEYFSGSLGIVNLNDPSYVVSLPLGKDPEMSAARRGEMLFNDATKCFQSWQSCVSCHPDIRSDGLNWDLMNDGIGNPKNTKSLLLSHQTPPVMGHGIRASAELAVRSGFKYILFSAASEQDATAVDEYLKSITPLPSPYLIKGKLSRNAQKGKELFKKAGCINCHSGPYFTNMKSYDVGTLKFWNSNIGKLALDVPTLIEVWRSSPYLHDGRTTDIKKAFSSCNSEGVKDLSPEDKEALEAYVLSL